MAQQPLSDQAKRRKAIIKHLLSHGEYKTPKEIEEATGISTKDITRSISDIRQCEDYRTTCLKQPFRVRLECMKKINDLWRIVFSKMRINHEHHQKTTVKVCRRQN